MTNRPCVVLRQVIHVGPQQIRAVITRIYDHPASRAHCQVYYKWQGKEFYEDVSWNWEGKSWELQGNPGSAERPPWQPYREMLLGPPLSKAVLEQKAARPSTRRRQKK